MSAAELPARNEENTRRPHRDSVSRSQDYMKLIIHDCPPSSHALSEIRQAVVRPGEQREHRHEGGLVGGLTQTPVFCGLRCPEGTGLSGRLNPADPSAGWRIRPGALCRDVCALPGDGCAVREIIPPRRGGTTASPQGNSPTHTSRGCCARIEVLGHQDPADEQAVHLLPDFFQALDEVMAEKV
jgi:hypothetical protein